MSTLITILGRGRLAIQEKIGISQAQDRIGEFTIQEIIRVCLAFEEPDAWSTLQVGRLVSYSTRLMFARSIFHFHGDWLSESREKQKKTLLR